MKKIAVELIAEKDKLAAGKEQEFDILIKITPPEIQKASERPKMNLSLVLDRSGSMQGSKIEQAKMAAAHCVEQLLPIDRMSLVTFDDNIDVLIPSAAAGNIELYKNLIGGIQTGGSTALHEAWVKGGLEVSAHLDDTRVNRVILITDGQANVGETRTETIVSQVSGLARKGISTSTIGIGRDFNEDLLVPMAEAGDGNAWHVEEAGDMKRIFETELGGALNQIGRGASMLIRPTEGVRLVDVLNDFQRDSEGRYLLPNLIGGRPLEIAVRLRVPARDEEDSIRPIEVEIEYTDVRSGSQVEVSQTVTLGYASAGVAEMLPQNEDVLRVVALLMNARARTEAMRRMDAGDYYGAQIIIDDALLQSEPLASVMRSPEFDKDVRMLKMHRLELDNRSEDQMTRKRLAYAARHRRTGRE